MNSSLHSKVQLLGALLAVFTLLSVPLFFQVKEDARSDRDTYKSTVLNRFFADMARDLKDQLPEDAEIEDAWGDYVKEQGPDCGVECNPDGDLDGDGVSNKREVELGRNPNCNEDVEGKEVCEGRDPTQPPDPQNVTALNDLLYQRRGAGPLFQDQFTVPDVAPYYDFWRVEWEVREWQGVGGYTIRIEDENGTSWCCPNENVQFLANTDVGNATLAGEDLPPPGNYQITVDTGSFNDGNWDLFVHGVRLERTAVPQQNP